MSHPGNSNGGYIVLAEDNPSDVDLVREALAEHKIGCDLKVFSDGEEAVRFFAGLDAAEAEPCPKLLLLDFYLPKRDGPEILQHLRASGRCGNIPVVMMTSLASARSQRDSEAANRHSALYYFQKPSSFDRFMLLGNLVQEVLNDEAGKARATPE